MARWQENYQLYKRYMKNVALLYQRRKDIRSYVELMLSLAVIIVFSIFAIRPTVVTIAQLNRDMEAKRETIEKLDNKLANLQKAKEIIDENDRLLSLVDTAVPNGPRPALYSRQIEGLAKKHNASLINLSVDQVNILGTNTARNQANNNNPENVADRYPSQASSITYAFDISGSYDDLNQFIFELERLRRPTFIDTLRLSTRDTSEGTQLVLSVTGRAPYLAY